MIYGEKKRRYRFDGKGLVWTVELICDCSDIEPFYSPFLPKIGDAWSPQLPYLKCVNIDVDELEERPGICRFVADFSSEGVSAEEYVQIRVEHSLRASDVTKSRTWESTGTPVLTDITTDEPVTHYIMTVRDVSAPYEKIQQAIGKINEKKFRGFAPETMRFDGADTEESYDQEGNLLSVTTTYSFTVLDKSHNYDWRPALIARDVDYNEIYWQCIDEDEPFYTTDPTKVGTPVYVNQLEGQSNNPAGVAGWDKAKDSNGKYKYELCDFATVLGLPRAPGDEE